MKNLMSPTPRNCVLNALITETLDVTLDECDNGVEGYKPGELRPNGFYEENIVRDYPVRGRKMSFHIKLRRWVEIDTGKSVSRCWNLVAEGTRFSKEFAAFFKDMLGQIYRKICMKYLTVNIES